MCLTSDEGVSGSEDIKKRYGLCECFNFIKINKKTINYIVVQKFDRFARDTILLGYLEFELKRNNCELIAVEQIFTNDPIGKLMKDIIAAFAAFEKNMINLRTSSGKKNKVKKKLFTSGKVPLGYKLIKSNYFEIDEKTAPIIRKIFVLRKRNSSYRAISAYIKEEFNYKIHFTTVKYILHNRVYIGTLTQEKNYSITVPAIISEEDFCAVQK